MSQLNQVAELNPYQPPESDFTAPPSATRGIHREGDALVVPRLCTLPPRCVKCNAPMAGSYLEKKLYWHSSGWYFLVFVNLIIYAVVASMVRKSATLEYGLCATHQQARRRGVAIIIALLVGGLALGIAGPAFDVPELLVVLPIAWLAAAIYAIVRTNVLKAVHIDDLNARIRGASAEFLGSLPY
jgi:hypothetical protein